MRKQTLALWLGVVAISAVVIAGTPGDNAKPTPTEPSTATESADNAWAESSANTRPAFPQPSPRKKCTKTWGASGGYLGCKVEEGGESTTYYNCTNNDPPCMDEDDCESCDVPD